MSKQYDDIGARYQGMEDLPCRPLENATIDAVLADVYGLKCLDLACGLGRWSHRLINDKGAAFVLGVDISQGMIDAATDSISDLPSDVRSKFAFAVADCSKPFVAQEGPFDLVLATWFLNYAESPAVMGDMFANIRANLRPSGRLVGMTGNVHEPMHAALEAYGIRAEPVAVVPESGWKTRVTAFTTPEKVSFENYHWMHDVYERAAREGGMGELRWKPYVLPQDDGRPQGYWDAFELRPHFHVFSCVKPQ